MKYVNVFIITLILITSICSVSYAEDVPLKLWFEVPNKQNITPKDSKIKTMLYRANRPRVVYRNRYYPEASSGREQIDCAAYKYVDCSNFTFHRCWQCKEYDYKYEARSYR